MEGIFYAFPLHINPLTKTNTLDLRRGTSWTYPSSLEAIWIHQRSLKSLMSSSFTNKTIKQNGSIVATLLSRPNCLVISCQPEASQWDCILCFLWALNILDKPRREREKSPVSPPLLTELFFALVQMQATNTLGLFWAVWRRKESGVRKWLFFCSGQELASRRTVPLLAAGTMPWRHTPALTLAVSHGKMFPEFRSQAWRYKAVKTRERDADVREGKRGVESCDH